MPADHRHMANERIPGDRVEQVFTRTRAQYLESRVFALGVDGWFIDAPADLNTEETATSAGGETALDLVTPESRPAVLAAWARCRSTGAADAAVKLRETPDTDTTLLFVDLREVVGTFALLMVPQGTTAEIATDTGIELAPRLSQIRRDETSHITTFDAVATAMFGWPSSEMIGKKSIDFIHPDDQDRAIDNWLEMLSRPGHASRWRGRFLRQDREWMWVEITNHNRIADAGEVLTEFLDIRDEMAMHEELAERERLFRQLTQALPVGVIQFEPDGSAVFANERLEFILGAKLTGLADLERYVETDDREQFTEVVRAVAADGEAAEIELHMETASTKQIVCQLTVGRIATNNGNSLLLCISDITEKSRLRAELEVRATLDALTQCHNRSSTLRHLTQLLRANQGAGAGVVFIDLDGFKPVNDQFGHAAGDTLLQIVADRLRGCSRSNDVVGRLGGDEFVVLFKAVQDQSTLDILTGRVFHALNAPIMLNETPFELRASLGTALGAPGDEPDTVLALADLAMYEQKRRRAQHPEDAKHAPTEALRQTLG